MLTAYEVVPARAPVAAWLRHLLAPVISACQLRSPAAIELRPTGDWRGRCQPLDEMPNGRVCLSGRARFWSHRDLIALYLHESAHRCLPGREDDPVFSCLTHALMLRTDVAGLTVHAAPVYADLYNISDLPAALADEPDQGLGRALSWSVLIARELAVTELDAEDLAAEVVRRFDLWIAEVAGEPARRAQRLRQVSRQQEVVERLKEKVWTLKCVVSLLSLLVVSLVVAGIK